MRTFAIIAYTWGHRRQLSGGRADGEHALSKSTNESGFWLFVSNRWSKGFVCYEMRAQSQIADLRSLSKSLKIDSKAFFFSEIR